MEETKFIVALIKHKYLTFGLILAFKNLSVLPFIKSTTDEIFDTLKFQKNITLIIWRKKDQLLQKAAAFSYIGEPVLSKVPSGLELFWDIYEESIMQKSKYISRPKFTVISPYIILLTLEQFWWAGINAWSRIREEEGSVYLDK